MRCPLLEAAYHHSIGGFLAVGRCHSSKAALSQSCHIALFVNPVARASTDPSFTSCDVHVEHERVSQATRSAGMRSWPSTHPLLPLGSSTQLDFVSVGFFNYLMEDFVVAVDDVKLEEKFVREVVVVLLVETFDWQGSLLLHRQQWCLWFFDKRYLQGTRNKHVGRETLVTCCSTRLGVQSQRCRWTIAL